MAEKQEAQAPRQQLSRRLSFEEKLNLSELPKPSFKAPPVGQRSVPALDKPALFTPIETSDPQSGTLTPGAAGQLGLGNEPWNLFPQEKDGKNSAWQQRPEGAQAHNDLHRPRENLARSSSYTGDVASRRTQEQPRPVNPGLRRADTQRERHTSSLSILNAAEQSPPIGVTSMDELPAIVSPHSNGQSGQTMLPGNKAQFDLAASMQGLNLSNGYNPGHVVPGGPSGAPGAYGNELWTASSGDPAKGFYGATPNATAFGTNYFNTSFNPLSDNNAIFNEQNAYDMARRDSHSQWSMDPSRPAGNNRPGQYTSDLMSRASSGNYGLSAPRPAQETMFGYNTPPMGQMGQQYFNVFPGQQQRLPGAGLPRNWSGSNLTDYSAYGGAAAYPSGLVSSAFAGGQELGVGAGAIMPGSLRYEDRSRGTRSPLLEEFRANRHRRWDLSDLRGHIVEFSSDQLGSRHLQTKLDSATVEEKRIFFDEMMPNVLPLSTDLFSNYVVQKAFEIADHNQKMALVQALEGHVLQLSLQMYGCRVIQKALECVLVDEQVTIVNELKGHVLKCARDQNANHVLQRVLERVPADRIKFIPESCEGQVYALATHPYGCRVLQRILENTSDVRPLIDELLKYTQTLMQDQYANYVIQHLLERGTKSDRTAIISNVRGQLVHLSKHKFASNVVDKVVLCADEEERRALTDEILYDPNAVSLMLRDQFANYCLQKFMLVVQGPQRDPLMARVAETLLTIRRSAGGTYSKHLLAIEKYIANEQAMNEYNRAAQAAAAAAASQQTF